MSIGLRRGTPPAEALRASISTAAIPKLLRSLYPRLSLRRNQPQLPNPRRRLPRNPRRRLPPGTRAGGYPPEPTPEATPGTHAGSYPRNPRRKLPPGTHAGSYPRNPRRKLPPGTHAGSYPPEPTPEATPRNPRRKLPPGTHAGRRKLPPGTHAGSYPPEPTPEATPRNPRRKLPPEPTRESSENTTRSSDLDATGDSAIHLGDITDLESTRYPTYTINGDDDADTAASADH